MNRLVMLLALVAWSALAQPTVTRGGALKKRAYQTYSALTYYVDPTGNDSNGCTGTGTDACATIGGALAKLPRFIRNNVTINVAAGTYAPVTVQNFVIQPGATLTLQGAALGNVASVPSGSVSGTLTGYTTTSFPVRPFVTDSTQTWPALWSAGDYSTMRGYFLTITGGTGSGQSRPIAQVDGTRLFLTSNFTTAPVAGSTYAIQEPTTIISGSNTTLFNIGRVTGSVAVNNFKFLQTSGGATSVISTTQIGASGLRITFTLCQLNDSAGSGSQSIASFTGPGDIITFSNTSFIMGNNNVGVSFSGTGQQWSLANTYYRGQRGFLSAFSYGGFGSVTSSAFDSYNITASTVLAATYYNNRMTLSNAWLTCVSGYTGVYYGGFRGIESYDNSSISGVNVSVQGCGSVFKAYKNSTVTMSSGTLYAENINASGYLAYGPAISVSDDATVDLSGATTVTFTTGDSGVVAPVYDGGGQYGLCEPTKTTELFSDTFLLSLPAGSRYISNPACGTIRR